MPFSLEFTFLSVLTKQFFPSCFVLMAAILQGSGGKQQISIESVCLWRFRKKEVFIAL